MKYWLFGICGGIAEHVNESLNRIIWWKTHIEKNTRWQELGSNPT
jgi:hypothetical protein